MGSNDTMALDEHFIKNLILSKRPETKSLLILTVSFSRRLRDDFRVG